MNSKKTLIGFLALVAVLVAGGLWMFSGKSAPEEGTDERGESLVHIITTRKTAPAKTGARVVSGRAGEDRGGRDDADDGPDDEPETPAEKALKRWEDIIAVFYEETEDEEGGGDAESNNGTGTAREGDPALGTQPRVTLEDQLRIRDAFREMDEDNKMEEVHHAMNLLPDETVAVMYGVLFDKTQSEDIMDVIFSDILNRDEDIKNPMMREIRRDQTHPMYTEAARILDVIEDD
ncbi:MAG: hypothetical protein FWH21_02300 [Kiritimatiellaeota bacterium]|nr:hypothetical protein [Kiritimatiellota bacterium]